MAKRLSPNPQFACLDGDHPLLFFLAILSEWRVGESIPHPPELRCLTCDIHIGLLVVGIQRKCQFNSLCSEGIILSDNAPASAGVACVSH